MGGEAPVSAPTVCVQHSHDRAAAVVGLEEPQSSGATVDTIFFFLVVAITNISGLSRQSCFTKTARNNPLSVIFFYTQRWRNIPRSKKIFYVGSNWKFYSKKIHLFRFRKQLSNDCGMFRSPRQYFFLSSCPLPHH